MSRRMSLALRAVVSCGLLALVATQIELAPVRAAFLRVDLGLLALSVLVYVSVVAALSALRWMVVCRSLGLAMSLRHALELVYVGFFFGQFLPAGVGGDAMRAWRTRALGVDWERTVHAVLIDRLLALATTALILIAFWPVVAQIVLHRPALLSIALVVLAIGAGVAFLLAASRVVPESAPAWLAHVRRFSNSMRCVLLTRYSLPALLVSSLVHLSAALVVWIIARGLAIEVSLLTTFVLVPLVLLAAMLPISMGGWGVREGAMVALFGFAGVEPGAAFALSVLFGLASVAAGLPGALLWLRDPVRE